MSPMDTAALLAYAAAKTTAESWRAYAPVEHAIVTYDLRGQSAEADAVRRAYNLIAPFVSIRTRRADDAQSPYSIPNFYAEGNKVRDDYDARVAVEYARLRAFDFAVKIAAGDLPRLLQLLRNIASDEAERNSREMRAA